MNRTFSRVVFMGAVLTMYTSCNSDSNEPAASNLDDAGPMTEAGEPANDDELNGTFTIDIAAPRAGTGGFGLLIGRVYDGPVPPTLPVEVAEESAGCQLLVPAHPFCEVSCGGEAACTGEDVCTPYPKTQDMGTLQVTGLGEAFSLEPASASSVYQSSTLPFPPCQAGAELGIQAERFTLKGSCVAPLELTTPGPIEVKTGRGVTLSWTTPPLQQDESRIEIALDIAHHGGAKGEIVCDVPDVGSFEIPERLVSRLIALGVAGFPDIRIARVSKTAAKELPEVRLVVSSGVQRDVDLGSISCFRDDDCTEEGTRCNTVLYICE
jgi:hypothetical protein